MSIVRRAQQHSSAPEVTKAKLIALISLLLIVLSALAFGQDRADMGAKHRTTKIPRKGRHSSSTSSERYAPFTSKDLVFEAAVDETKLPVGGMKQYFNGANVVTFSFKGKTIEMKSAKIRLEGAHLVVRTTRFGTVRIVAGDDGTLTVWVTPSEKQRLLVFGH